MNDSQVGGNNTYEFLNLTSSARIASMGSDFLTIYDNDITLVESKPSLINPAMSNKLGVAYVDFFSDVNYGFATYAKSFKNIGSFAAVIAMESFCFTFC